jgi:hypothetical protein
LNPSLVSFTVILSHVCAAVDTQVATTWDFHI